jgi:hypothetical protein
VLKIFEPWESAIRVSGYNFNSCVSGIFPPSSVPNRTRILGFCLTECSIRDMHARWCKSSETVTRLPVVQ